MKRLLLPLLAALAFPNAVNANEKVSSEMSDIEEGDLNRPEMTAKLVCTLETAMYRAMQEKQYSAVASNAKVLMKLIGLEAKIKS